MDDGMKPRVLLVATGGTISMRGDASRGGAVPRLSGTEVLASVPGWERVAQVGVVEFGWYPGPHMTNGRMGRVELMLALGEYGADLGRVRKTIEWGRYDD